MNSPIQQIAWAATFSLISFVASDLRAQPETSAVDQTYSKPNIVYILADDLGYGDVQCLNPERGKIATPQIDSLAAAGISFTDAHSGSSVCTPTRYGILTGRYCWRTRLQSSVLFGADQPLIPTSRMTVASFLKQHDYHTACIGKWHLGLGLKNKDGSRSKGLKADNLDWGQQISGGPVELGFDYYYGIAASLDIPPHLYIQNDRFVGAATAIATKEFHPRRRGPAHPDFKAVDVLDEIGRQSVQYLSLIHISEPTRPY